VSLEFFIDAIHSAAL